jgi:hypothetical protein
MERNTEKKKEREKEICPSPLPPVEYEDRKACLFDPACCF